MGKSRSLCSRCLYCIARPYDSFLVRSFYVLGDPQQNDCWIEDGSIAAISMQYQIEDLGLGSCWIQMRGRGLSDGTTASSVIRGILDIPEQYEVLCVLAVGNKADERKLQDEDKLKWENVHLNKF